ncbi:MAG: hypothetical protein K9G33_14330 [Sneathiella sp.]|nr:hypothetical protein [Sneathiella sp.]
MGSKIQHTPNAKIISNGVKLLHSLRMVESQKPSQNTLLKSIQACIDNGERLLDETYDLEFREPPSSRFFLTMIAQEEFAKAFILFLVKEDVIYFSPHILRSINDHTCKQLVGIIMDYIIMHWEEIDDLERAIREDANLSGLLPNDVGSAMEILRYEKIGRWESGTPIWSEDPNYDKSALRIAKGKKDQRKQDSLYVRIGRDGRVCSTPQIITEDERYNEYERAYRYCRFVKSVLSGEERTPRFDRAQLAFKILFKGIE